MEAVATMVEELPLLNEAGLTTDAAAVVDVREEREATAPATLAAAPVIEGTDWKELVPRRSTLAAAIKEAWEAREACPTTSVIPGLRRSRRSDMLTS